MAGRGNSEGDLNLRLGSVHIDDRHHAAPQTLSFSAQRVIGNGSFGVVFQALVVETREVVAIKKVLQDKRFKNRELQIMRSLTHCNVVSLKQCFYSNGDQGDEVYLNLVMEFIPDTVHRLTRDFARSGQPIPLLDVKLYTYQLLRGLHYIHSRGICHRDIKPQNLLVDPSKRVLKLCDFGSAKVLQPDQPNVSYICSRYYRAPELIFGATNYSTAIDIWSAGCVFAELLLRQPLFPGESGVDQLVEIIKVMGTPSRHDIEAMNPNYSDFRFPHIKPHPLERLFGPQTPPQAIDLLRSLLAYDPSVRIHPLRACAHPFFDELRDPATQLPDGGPLPDLFSFTPEELGNQQELAPLLIPEHAQASWGAGRHAS